LGRLARFHAAKLRSPAPETHYRIGFRQNENCW
jgi:hypothetical protein